MQSSRMNSEKLRLTAERQSVKLSRAGAWGGRPARASDSVAADKAEAAERGLRLAFAAAPEDQASRRPDAAGEQEAQPARAGGAGRRVRAQLPADVGGLADAVAQVVGGAGELLSLRLDVAAHVRQAAGVPTGHRSSVPPRSALLLGSPARG